MGTFSQKFIESVSFHPSTTWLISQCSEAKGKQKLWETVRPESLMGLQKSAMIHSAESSNRIEGVIVSKERLPLLVLGKSRPLDRSEEEIQGYRKALDYIHQNYTTIKISPDVIKLTHKLAQGGMISGAGVWKKSDNDIIQIDENGDRKIRFSPVKAESVEYEIEQLCLGYRDSLSSNSLPDLIAIANFILDFLCIHPFRDGNGRVSRLLTLLLLYQSSYGVGRFISLEKIIEDNKEDYYQSLYESSQGWHEGKFHLMPWWNFFARMVKESYQQLEDRIHLISGSDNQSDLIRESIRGLHHDFSISDLCNLSPGINRELIKKVLNKMSKNNEIEKVGAGRTTKWRRVV